MKIEKKSLLNEKFKNKKHWNFFNIKNLNLNFSSYHDFCYFLSSIDHFILKYSNFHINFQTNHIFNDI